jgi:tetratricopeptide (TPR) repeat protein
LVALLLAFAAAGCSGVGSLIDRLPDDAPARGFVLLPKPLSLPRSRYTADCVPESLCAVMNYYGKPASIEELSFLARKPDLAGIPFTQIPELVRLKGFKCTFVEGSVGRIKNAVDRGVPPIINVQGGAGFHAFVVIGYSDRERTVVCEEYGDAKRLISYEEIEEIWQPAGHTMLELEVSRAEALFAEGAVLESRGRYADAASLYRKSLEIDAGFYEARVGLGNCLLFQRKYEEAVAEYKRAYETNSSDPKVCNNLANIYLELKRDLPEAEKLAEKAVEKFEAVHRHARSSMEQELQPAVRAIRQSELKDAELDLADALGTLGQARAANEHHDLAIAAWKAARDHYPLTEFDVRAKRSYEIALSCRALNMPAEARRHLDVALREAKDPDLRARIEAAISK